MPTPDLLHRLQHTTSVTTALTLVDGTEQRLCWSFADLRQEAAAAAQLLRDCRAGPGTAVLLLARNSPCLLALFLSTLEIDCCFVPLHPDLAGAQLQHVLDETQPAIVIIDAYLPPALLQHLKDYRRARLFRLRATQRPWLREVLRQSVRQSVRHGQARQHSARSSSRQPVLLLYSSGSTGKPKALCYTRATLNTFLFWQTRLFAAFPDTPSNAAPLSPRINVLPLAHFGGLSFCLQALLEMRTVHLLGNYGPDQYLQLIRDTGCQLLLLVPSLYQPLLALGNLRPATPQLRHCLTLGEALTPQLAAAIECCFQVPVSSAYGMSEALSGLGHAPAAGGQCAPPGSCGRLLFGAVRLVDPAGNAAEDCGELWVSNATTTPCYADPVLNQQKYQDGWYRTGDLFRRDSDGWFWHQGRVDTLCINNGCKVFPQEVESVLLLHPDIVGCLVAPLRRADGRQRLGALICRRPGTSLSAQALIDFWLQLGPLHATPTWLLFTDGLPLNANGKQDRLAAASLLQQDYDRQQQDRDRSQQQDLRQALAC